MAAVADMSNRRVNRSAASCAGDCAVRDDCAVRGDGDERGGGADIDSGLLRAFVCWKASRAQVSCSVSVHCFVDMQTWRKRSLSGICVTDTILSKSMVELERLRVACAADLDWVNVCSNMRRLLIGFQTGAKW